MDNFWRSNDNWAHVGGSHKVPAPQIPARPKVRVRAIAKPDGSPPFCVDGQPVAGGAVALVDADDAPRLIFEGKAELVS